ISVRAGRLAGEEVGNEKVQQRNHEEQEPSRSQHDPLQAPGSTDAGRTRPGDPLHQGDEPDECDHVPHERDHTGGSTIRKVLVVLLPFAAWLWQGYAHADVETPPTTGSDGVGELTVVWAALLGALQGATE